ncbi:MAG: hypothetical protein ACPG3T_06075 [Pseudomonadales bacterium]
MLDVGIVGDNLRAEIRRGDFNGRPSGLVAFTHDLYSWRQRSLVLVNDDFGRDMNVNGAASGATENMHNGIDAVYWTGSAAAGTSWDFNNATQANTGTFSIECSLAADGDLAAIAKGSDLDMTAYNVISGAIYIDRMNEASQDIVLYFERGGLLIGNEISLNNYVDASLDGAWQSFQIPKSDLGIADVNVDTLYVRVDRAGGLAPTFYLDDLLLRADGSVVFTATPRNSTTFQYNIVEFTVVDNNPSTVTNGTMPGLSYNQFMGLANLPNGCTLQVFREGGVPGIAVALRNLFDWYSSTFEIASQVSDGTNTMTKLRVHLPVWETLIEADGDKFQFSINDDLSGLLEFRGILIGRELIPHED